MMGFNGNVSEVLPLQVLAGLILDYDADCCEVLQNGETLAMHYFTAENEAFLVKLNMTMQKVR